MALIIKDRVQETSTTSGTGTLTLAGAVTGYQSFASAIGSGNTTYYAIYETQTVNWEVGIGTVGSGTLARTTVLASSNGGSLVSFGGAQLAVWGDMPAAKGLYTDYVGTVTGLSIGGNAATVTNGVYTTDTGTVTNTMLAGSIANGKLQNSSITINGTPTALGGSVSVGTVTSVTGTAPIASSGGATPAISISQATTSTNGYLSSTDWNTFNNKGSGTVTSVTGTSPISSTGGATPAISISQATTSTNGYLSSTDWNTFNGKAPAVTYTTNYIPFGQGTTTPNQSSSLQWDGSTMRVGANALLGGTTNPIVGITGTANNYIQSYIYNSNTGISTSADIVAYANNSTDAHGWADMGFTGSNYADTTYTVTGPNEAYLFGSAPSGSGKTGNLVYATDSTGTANVHQFYVGGFTQSKTAWKAQIDGNGLQATQLRATNGIVVNSKTVSANYTIASGDSAMSAGPISISSGVTVTVSSGSKWVVL